MNSLIDLEIYLAISKKKKNFGLNLTQEINVQSIIFSIY